MVFNTERMKASMGEDEFTLIIDAILSGKYSWACVLILKNAGYEPGHYIPYRTLNRLIKENGFPSCSSAGQPPRRMATKRTGSHTLKKSIQDLNYLKPSEREARDIKGGHFSGWASLESKAGYTMGIYSAMSL